MQRDKRVRIRAMLVGNSRWTRVLGEQLELSGIKVCRYVGDNGRLSKVRALLELATVRIIHNVSVPLEEPRMLYWARCLGKHLVFHWIGSDVMNLHAYYCQHQAIPGFLSHSNVSHVAVSPALQDELRQCGIEADLVQLLTDGIESDVLPLPERPAVLSYWSDLRAGFYGSHLVLELARKLPDVPFYILGASGLSLPDTPENVVFLQTVTEMKEMYSKVSVLCRFVEHDGLSAMVLEALATGRYVLYTQEFPHTIRVRGVSDALETMRRLLAERQPNLAGAEYVRKTFSRKRQGDRLVAVYKRLSA